MFEGTKSAEAFLVPLRYARGELADHSLRCLLSSADSLNRKAGNR